MTVKEFFERHGAALMAAAERSFPPVVREVRPSSWSKGRRSLGAQALALAALAEGLKRERALFLSAEMGTGKSHMAVRALLEWKPDGVFLVVCPPHLVPKWAREVEAEGAHAVVLRSSADVLRLREAPRPVFGVVSRERAKLGNRRAPGFATRLQKGWDGVTRAPVCPRCGSELTDEEGSPLSLEEAERAEGCRACGEVLWQEAPLSPPKRPPKRFPEPGDPPWPLPPRRESLYRALRRLLPRGFVDGLVLDDAHEYKDGNSLQGRTAAGLAAMAKRVLLLSGTLFGGYASSVYHLLAAALPGFRQAFPEPRRFVEEYGLVRGEVFIRTDRRGRVSLKKVQVRELPGISPRLLTWFLPRSVFLRLEDVAPNLPPYREEVLLVEMDPWHEEEYRRFEADLRGIAAQAMAVTKSPARFSNLVQAGLQVPDAPWRSERVVTKWGSARHEGLMEAYRPAKERLLLELLRGEKREGRKAVVYLQAVGKRDLMERLARLLEEVGIRAAALRSDRVPPEKREAWIRKRLEEGAEVLLVHPAAVQTGLDLVDFPTVVFYQPTLSVYTLRQAARRSWRVGQTRPVRVYYLAYRGTLQEAALALAAQKAQAALAMEGVFPDEGLVSVAEEDPALALVRHLLKEAEVSWRGGRIGIVEVPDPAEAARRAWEELRAKRGGELVPLFEGVPPPRPKRRKGW